MFCLYDSINNSKQFWTFIFHFHLFIDQRTKQKEEMYASSMYFGIPQTTLKHYCLYIPSSTFVISQTTCKKLINDLNTKKTMKP